MKYWCICRKNITSYDKEKIFKELEKIGYRLIFSNFNIGIREENKIWGAINNKDEVIICNGYFFQKVSKEKLYINFSKKEYEVIKGIK